MGASESVRGRGEEPGSAEARWRVWTPRSAAEPWNGRCGGRCGPTKESSYAREWTHERL